MNHRPDCIHHLDLCPACDGLRVTRMERLDGVESVTLDAGPFSFSGPAEVYIGPVAEDCAVEET
ncbi:hypothetical protein [Streptomyces sp.]|uniref:hypothetical protein n=1 Tax=Streptomyces sp. TaxID=1931 RepID=UPI002F935A7A